jgi:hypothetical protein
MATAEAEEKENARVRGRESSIAPSVCGRNKACPADHDDNTNINNKRKRGKKECNRVHLLLSVVSDWSIIIIRPGGLLFICCPRFQFSNGWGCKRVHNSQTLDVKKYFRRVAYSALLLLERLLYGPTTQGFFFFFKDFVVKSKWRVIEKII